MKSKKLLLLLVPAALALAACNGDLASTSSAGGEESSSQSAQDSQGSQGQGSGSESTVPPVEYTYKVDIEERPGITIVPDKTEAKEGETVTLTITLEEGWTLLSLTVNGTEIEVVDGKATFTMPDVDAHVRVTLGTDAPVSIAGDIAAAMTKEGELYVARNVECETASSFYIAIQGEEHDTYVAYDKLNRYKCFGNITYSSDDLRDILGDKVPESQRLTALVELGGNAAYDIFYDVAKDELYIQRVAVLTLPDSPEDYEELFAGNILSESSSYPEGVNHVEFSDSMRDEDYSWDLYEGNASLATVTDENERTYYEYHSLEEGVLTTVDTYVEYYKVPNPYSTGATTEIVDDTKTEDTTRFSGRYNIVEEVASGMSQREMTEEDALFQIENYSHDMEAIDRMQWRAYRSSFDLEEDLVKAERDVQSVENEDGSFTVTVKSEKTYDPTKGNASYNYMTEKTHIEYEIVATFTEAGAPLTGSYKEFKYGELEYDFDRLEFVAGGELGGINVKSFEWSYSYGDPKEGTPDFDPTPYFATAVEAHLEDEEGNPLGNTVDRGWSTDDDEVLLVIEATGENAGTALDAWQYTVTGTSVPGLFVQDSWNPNVWTADPAYDGAVDSATLNLGNNVDGVVRGTFDINVVDATVNSFYLTPVDQWSSDPHLTTANTFAMYSDTTWTSGIHSSPDDNANLNNVTIETSNPVLQAEVDPVTRTVKWTAGHVDVDTVVQAVILTDDYNEGWDETVFTCTIVATEVPPITEEDVVGTWRLEQSEDSDLPDLTAPDTLVFKEDHTGTLYTVMTDGTEYNFTFAWELDTNAGLLYITDVVDVEGKLGYLTANVAIEIRDPYRIGIELHAESIAEGEDGWVSNVTQILGAPDSLDDEGLPVGDAEYVFWLKVSE